jgi:SAM-dependent methyltransferase
MIAVGLLTCDRADYTARTLRSFSAQNPDARESFILLHGDDASVEPTNTTLAHEHGFETVGATHSKRLGARLLRTDVVRAAADRGADWILLLENDWDWVRPFPWALFRYVTTTQPNVYTLRLYGQYKERNNKCRCMTVHAGRGRRPVTWQPLTGAPEAAEIAAIHWGAPPAVTRLAEALELHRDPGPTGGSLSSDAFEMQISGQIAGLVARVVNNVVYHIGDQPTVALRRPPARLPAKRPKQTLYTSQWQATRRWTREGSSACLDVALEVCGTPASLLDVGCGDGHLVEQAAAKGVQSLGVDLSVNGNATSSLLHADLREPLTLEQRFELVLCWEVAEHLPAESADVLCDSLVRHLAPGGTLLFTAARPGQGGHGHIHCMSPAYWREKLESRGLTYDARTSARLGTRWTAVAPRTPWYGANVQAFRDPAWVPTLLDPTAEAPRLAVTMRTADRRPKGPNYVGGTVKRLLSQGLKPDALQICATSPDVTWLRKELGSAAVTLHIPERPLTPNENGLAQITNLYPDRYDFVLLLEDDLEFCDDFIGSVKRWIAKHARPDRHVYRLFTFGARTSGATQPAYDDHSLAKFRGTQAVVLRMADALDFVTWARANLTTWGGFRGNAKIAFDKLLASWALARWPKVPAVLSQPLFVRHIGTVSSIHPKTAHNDARFAGTHWSYR